MSQATNAEAVVWPKCGRWFASSPSSREATEAAEAWILAHWRAWRDKRCHADEINRRLAEIRADPADRRAWRLYLTTRAADLLGGIRPVVEALNDEAIEGLSAAERDRLLDLVARVRTNLSRRVCAKEAEPA